MSGLFDGVENKELYIIGAVLFLLLLSNNFSFTGLAHSRNVYEERNPYYRGFQYEGVPIRQDASMAMKRDVGRLSASEYRRQNPSQQRSGIGGTCYLNNGGEGILTLGDGNSLYCG